MRIFDSSVGNLYEIILNLQEEGIGKSYYETFSVNVQEGGLAILKITFDRSGEEYRKL